jgi:TonB family protein
MPETVSCETFESLAVLHALGELEPAVRAAVEEHARACPACAAVLQRETTLAAILGPARRDAAEQEPSDLLLAQCRSDLGKSLDEIARPRGWRQWLRPRSWTEALRVSAHVHPAWSVAALLFVAAISGLAGWEGLGRVPLQLFAPTVITVAAAAPAAPMIAPTAPEATPQPQVPEQHAANADPGSTQIYSATDAAMSEAPAPGTFPVGPTFDENAAPLWRHEPPLRMPHRHSLRGSASTLPAPDEGRLAGISRKMETLWWGAVRVDPSEQQKRLVQGSLPEYPEVARRAGIEGRVTLLLRIGPDGAVQDAQLLSGEPVLGRAAAGAAEQWRYQPVRIDGQPVSVLTSVTLAFELR